MMFTALAEFLGSAVQMVQRPQWRRRAAESGVLVPLVTLVEPGILDVVVEAPMGSFEQQQVAYNMLVQVLMTINWWAPSPRAVLASIRSHHMQLRAPDDLHP